MCPEAPSLPDVAERLSKETRDPSILDKTAHYVAALGGWAISGFKTRTDDEVSAIYSQHCRPCDKRDPDADACRVCGCNVTESGWAVRNKIKMASEHCPDGKW